MGQSEHLSASGLDNVLGRLRSILPELKNVHGIRSLGVFGSYARGDHTEQSDLDILVDFESPPTLFEFVSIQRKLSTSLHLKVDLVMKTSLKPHIGRRVLRELVLI